MNTTCYRHPTIPTLAACADCGRSVCSLCARFEAGQASCPEHGRHRQVGPSLQEMGVKQFSGPVLHEQTSGSITIVQRIGRTSNNLWQPIEVRMGVVDNHAKAGLMFAVLAIFVTLTIIAEGAFVMSQLVPPAYLPPVASTVVDIGVCSLLVNSIFLLVALVGSAGGLASCWLLRRPKATFLVSITGLLLFALNVVVLLYLFVWSRHLCLRGHYLTMLNIGL